MKKIFLTIMALFWLTIINAQHDTLKYGGGCIFPAFNEADISNFNNFLVANNFPTEGYWPFSIQVEGSLYYKKFKASIDVGGLIDQPKKNNDTTIEYSTSFITFDIAYDVLTLKKLRLYPFAGYTLAGLTYDYKIEKNYNSFQNYLKTPTYDKTMRYVKDNFVLGLGVEYGEKVALGIKSGLYIPMDNGRWKFDGNIIKDNIPTIDFKYFIDFYWTFRGIKMKKITLLNR